jgi:hypothetical protein
LTGILVEKTVNLLTVPHLIVPIIVIQLVPFIIIERPVKLDWIEPYNL